MKDPVDHITRTFLPWRKGALVTECGLNAAKVPTITRQAYSQRKNDLGSQRTAMLTCVTCASTVRHYCTWEEDPRRAMGREVEWETGWSREGRGELLRDELEAIAVLIEAHRQEFDAMVAERAGRREWLARKTEAEKARTKRK